MEVTKWLKPSECGSRTGDRASVQAATRVNAEQASHDGRVVKQYVLSFLEASRRRDGRWRNSSLYRAPCVGGDLFSYPVLRYETQESGPITRELAVAGLAHSCLQLPAQVSTSHGRLPSGRWV